jgi:hypothetical protein
VPDLLSEGHDMKSLLFFVLVPALMHAQGDDVKTQSLKKQAEVVAKAMVDNDHQKLVELTHPRVVELIGGKKKMVQLLENISKDIEARWPTRKVKVQEATGILSEKDESFGIVTYTLEMRGKGARITGNAFLIGVSSDGGKNWSFIDAAGKSLAEVKKLLPNFPKGLTLPAVQEPKFEKVDD